MNRGMLPVILHGVPVPFVPEEQLQLLGFSFFFFYFAVPCSMPKLSSPVKATRSGKQTHSEGQCRQWCAVYYTGGPKAESPLSQGP